MSGWIPRLAVAVGLFVFAIVAARWIEEGDYREPRTGRHHCGAPPAAIKAWSYTSRTRRSSDLIDLDRWLQNNPDEIDRWFGAFCWTPLQDAARFGREDLAKLLIARGANVRARDDSTGQTALHLAAQYGHAGAAGVLLDAGAEVNAKSNDGRTPLHEAVYGLAGTSDLDGRVAVATLLLARGADVNARDRGSQRTPLDYATGFSANRANVERMIPLLLAHGADTGTRDSQGDSVLQRAASTGNAAVVKTLLDRGADVDAAGRDTTPLGAAAYGGHVDVVALLLSRGADANRAVSGSRLPGNGMPIAMALGVTRERRTPDQDARRLRIATMLLDHGARVDARDAHGDTALHRAASRGDLPAVELLLSHGAGVDSADSRGFMPLHLAVREGHVEVARRLLVSGANVAARGADGVTVLELAADDPDMDALVRRYAKR